MNKPKIFRNKQPIGTFKNNIREVRKAKTSMSQANLATFAGISVNALKNIENGSVEPTLDELNKFAELLNCSIEDLLPPIEKATPAELDENAECLNPNCYPDLINDIAFRIIKKYQPISIKDFDHDLTQWLDVGERHMTLKKFVYEVLKQFIAELNMVINQ